MYVKLRPAISLKIYHVGVRTQILDYPGAGCFIYTIGRWTMMHDIDQVPSKTIDHHLVVEVNISRHLGEASPDISAGRCVSRSLARVDIDLPICNQ